MKKIKTGKELNINLQKCAELMRGRVYQYKSAGNCILEAGYYRRGRSMNRQLDGTTPTYWDIYYLSDEGTIETLCYNTSPRRSSQLLRALKDGTIHNISPNIIQNYATNGYTTRRGLFANYEKKEEKIKQIAQSHADYMGLETGNSTRDHYNRVAMR